MLKVRITGTGTGCAHFYDLRKQLLYGQQREAIAVDEPGAFRLPVFTGYPSEKIGFRADSILDHQIKDLSTFLNQDSFWSNAIEQVNITASKTFEMIPLIGNQVIEFGDGNRL